MAVTWRGTRRFPALVVICVAAPFLIVLIAVLSQGRWFPAGDMAQAELHMRGFFGHPPLVGAAGRIVTDDGYQGSHPGPSLWVSMLPLYLIGGRSSAALMASVVSVHVVSAVAALRLARLRYGWSFAGALGLVVIFVDDRVDPTSSSNRGIRGSRSFRSWSSSS